MENKIFDDCYQHYKDCDNNFWKDLAVKYGYSNAEVLRSVFKRERKKRGLPSKKEGVKEFGVETSKVYPKISVFDIETTPLKAFIFRLWDENIGVEQIISDTYLLSWSAKLLNEPEVDGMVLTPEEAIAGDDFRIVKGIWEYLSKCQILIGHNIKGYDLPKLNVRFLVHGLPPIANNQIIDTLLVARNNFSFSSNKLQYINKFLNIKQKIENEGFILWKKCVEGDPKALKTMFDYNIQDSIATEDLYFRLRPFIKGHPNLGLYNDIDEPVCPNCGCEDLKEEGFYFSTSNKYYSMRCNGCGALSRTKKNILSKEKSKNILRN